MWRAAQLSLVIAVLLGLTLLPKYLGAARRAVPDDARLARDMAGMLRAHGYQVQVRALPTMFHYADARLGDCRLIAANMRNAGYYRDRFAVQFAAVGAPRYIYRAGHSEAAFPRLLPLAEEGLQNWAFRFGLTTSRIPVIALAASPGCRPGALPWPSLRIWPAPFVAGRAE